MKTLTISVGDLHGKDYWRKIDIDKYDLIVFLGDYTDSFTESNVDILHNLKAVIKLKKRLKNKVVLLWGNHDVQYYFINDETKRCSGYRPEARFDLYEQFNKNRHLFQLAYQKDNYLWTHAGIHKGWFDAEYPFGDITAIADGLNKMFNERIQSIFDVGWMRGGMASVGGPLWLDKRMLIKKPVKGLHQIVGHTASKEIKTYNYDEETSVTICDVLQTETKFHELEF